MDVSVLGGYAALHERERAAASGARFVRRHARWDPAWSGTVIDSSEDDPSASRRRDETRDAAGRDASSRRRAESPDRLQRPPWDGGRSRGRDPGPPSRRFGAGPSRSPAARTRAAPSRDPRCAWSPRDATSTPPSPRAAASLPSPPLATATPPPRSARISPVPCASVDSSATIPRRSTPRSAASPPSTSASASSTTSPPPTTAASACTSPTTGSVPSRPSRSSPSSDSSRRRITRWTT